MSRHRNLRKVSTDVDYDDEDEYYDEDEPTDSYSRQYLKGAGGSYEEEEDYSSYGAPSYNPPPKAAPPATSGYTPQVKAKGGKKKGGSGGTPAKPSSPAPAIPKATPDKLPVASAITPSKPVSLSFHSTPTVAALSSHAAAGVSSASASGSSLSKTQPLTLDFSSKSKLNSGDAARPSVASHIAAGLVQNAHGSPRTDSPTIGSSTPATGSPSVDKPSIRRSTSMDIAAANRRDKERRQVLEEESKAASGKEQLNLVFVGHVDAGKSTLMGHLLYQVGRVDQRTIHKYEKESKNIGKASFHFAWVLDSSAEERARGITQDVGVNHFETASKTITLLDAPGHRDFIPNMISGAAQADAAVLVVPATKGEFEAGFADNGQTKEHALLCRSSGVGQVIIAVNKLDTCDWSESRYNDIVEQVSAFLRQAGYRPNTIWSVPVSGLSGENLLKATDATLLKWYKGPSLVEAIDKYFTPPERQLEKPFRLCITDTFKSMNLGVTVAGKVESGTVMPKDKVLLMPGGEAVTVKAVENQGTPLRIAKAGDNVEIGLKDLNEASNVVAGMYLCAVDSPIPLVTRFRAQVLVLGIKIPLMKGTEVELFTQSVHVPATISKLVHSLNKATGEVIKERPRHLTRNSSATIEVTTETPICLELYSQFRQLGRFSLRRESETVAVGIVSEILQAAS